MKNTLFFLLLCTFISCRFTPLGGGNLEVSSSIAESKEKGMFKREYKLISDSIFEYKDSIINIKLVFSDIFVENTHKEIRRVPAYKEKRYYNSGCDTCYEQFVAHLKIDSSELEYHYGYWYIDDNKTGKVIERIFISPTYEKYISDTLRLHLLYGYKYREKIGLDYRKFDKICFDTLTFVKK